eukprot:247095-Rhodomonas_salina.1
MPSLIFRHRGLGFRVQGLGFRVFRHGCTACHELPVYAGYTLKQRLDDLRVAISQSCTDKGVFGQ